MFVEVVIEAKPATPLLLVPKLSVKPATGSNQIWKLPPTHKHSCKLANGSRRLAPWPIRPRTCQGVVKRPNSHSGRPRCLASRLSVGDGVAVVGPYLGPAPLEDKPAESPSTGADSKAEPIKY